jgi:ribonucleoside-diphosphate reductase beta chain
MTKYAIVAQSKGRIRMANYSVFNTENKKGHMDKTMFLDEGVDVARYDQVKYSQFEKLTDKQLGFFWRPDEVDLGKDRKDFADLTEHERHIFTSNLKRQILLDSVQGRSPNMAFLPVVSLPELETWIETWSFSETIHSRSYTHIIRNVYSNPSKVFDEITSIQEILDCAEDISKYYDDLIETAQWYQLLGEGTHTVITDGGDLPKSKTISLYELKKKLYLTLMSVNILEGVRFYVSFACSWAFAELKKMEGNAKIIKFIARDENLHLASTQQILKNITKDDKDFESIAEECEAECIKMFTDAVEQEKQWAEYLFKDGSMIGLNKELLSEYIEWIGARRMQSVGLASPYKVSKANPLPWTQKWISGSSVQVAPQETEISSYVIGGVKQDVSKDTFKGISL